MFAKYYQHSPSGAETCGNSHTVEWSGNHVCIAFIPLADDCMFGLNHTRGNPILHHHLVICAGSREESHCPLMLNMTNTSNHQEAQCYQVSQCTSFASTPNRTRTCIPHPVRCSSFLLDDWGIRENKSPCCAVLKIVLFWCYCRLPSAYLG